MSYCLEGKNMTELEGFRTWLTESVGAGCLKAEEALRPELAGLQFFAEPLIGVAAPDDPLFSVLQENGVIGPHHFLPAMWLPTVRSVISVFLPFNGLINRANRIPGYPAAEWLHGRIEGQAFIRQLAARSAQYWEERGYSAVVPGLNPRYRQREGQKGPNDEALGEHLFTSNWSERHVAFVAGLGTFSLSRSFITEKGAAGRLFSLLTGADIPPVPRGYSRPDELCSTCGACVARCPAGAISLAEGKQHPPCAAFLNAVREKFSPRYGCGKCQTGTPCEHGAPAVASYNT
jgi:epoxyqueuosine reductase QueG